MDLSPADDMRRYVEAALAEMIGRFADRALRLSGGPTRFACGPDRNPEFGKAVALRAPPPGKVRAAGAAPPGQRSAR